MRAKGPAMNEKPKHIGRRCCGPPNCGYGETVVEDKSKPHLSRWINWCIGAECMAWREGDVFSMTGQKMVRASWCGLAGIEPTLRHP